MKSTPRAYDIVVSGDTLAGRLAAVRASRGGLRVLLIGAKALPWRGMAVVHPAIVGELSGEDASIRNSVRATITQLRLVGCRDGDERVVRSRQSLAVVLDLARLGAALGREVSRAGVEVWQTPATMADSPLGMEVSSGRRKATAGLLLTTDGQRATAGKSALVRVSQALDVSGRLPPKTGLILAGIAGEGSVASVGIHGSRGGLCVVCDASQTAEAIPRCLAVLASRCRVRCERSGRSQVTPVEPGECLYREEVGHAQLMFGEWAGFVSPLGDGIYPSVVAARHAVGVAGEYLRSGRHQDILRSFPQTWRSGLADYLRGLGPNANLLMPLAFRTEAMADRVVQLLLAGRKLVRQ